MLDYLAVSELAANRFPGFESEVQGAYPLTESDGSNRLYTFVLKD
jgi:ornithine decarboxylase